jgi:phosphatidylglycerophosphatase C
VADRPVVAAFDVDGTLTRRDCVVPFLLRLGATRLILGVAWRAPSVIAAFARRDRQRLKEIATGVAVRGRSVAAVEEVATTFGVEIEQWLRDDTTERLRWHRAQGHTVVLVSASYEVYLDVLGRTLGVDAVLATRLATVSDVDAVDGAVYTGALIGENCRGPEKLRRLDEWLAEWLPGRDGIEGGRHGVELWAYGDSVGDRELLGAADHPVWATSPLTSVPSTD